MAKSVLILFLTILVSCNRGLEPTVKLKNILSGNLIITAGTIPDSASAIRIGAFKKSSVNSLEEFIGEITAEEAFLSDTLEISKYNDTIPFSIEIEQTDIVLNYTVSAMEINGEIFNQRLISVYGGENQKSIELGVSDSIYIELFVDFTDLPPQPF